MDISRSGLPCDLNILTTHEIRGEKRFNSQFSTLHYQREGCAVCFPCALHRLSNNLETTEY